MKIKFPQNEDSGGPIIMNLYTHIKIHHEKFSEDNTKYKEKKLFHR